MITSDPRPAVEQELAAALLTHPEDAPSYASLRIPLADDQDPSVPTDAGLLRLAHLAALERAYVTAEAARLAWAVHERRKLRAHRRRFPRLPEIKNHGVFGPETTLLAEAAKAIRKHAHMTDAQMHDRRMARHAAASRH